MTAIVVIAVVVVVIVVWHHVLRSGLGVVVSGTGGGSAVPVIRVFGF